MNTSPSNSQSLPSSYTLHIHLSLSLSIRVCYNHNAQQFTTYNKLTRLPPEINFLSFTIHCFSFTQTQWVPTKTMTTCSSSSLSVILPLESPTSCPDSRETSSAWKPNPPSASNSPPAASPSIANSSRLKSGTPPAKKGLTFCAFSICMSFLL